MDKYPKLFKNAVVSSSSPSSEGGDDKELELRLAPPGEARRSDLRFRNCSNNKRRSGAAPVIGWPPIGSFRKNIGVGGSSSLLSKPASFSKSPNENPEEKNGGKSGTVNNNKKDMYVKINMEGVPIGRKINLSAYKSYDQLSFAIHQLFNGLLAASAQKDPTASGNETNKNEEWKVSRSCSWANGSDGYTLVYEDNEGDRVLVGDVPWPMFVTTVKKLLVLKSSQLSTLSRNNSGEQRRTPLGPAEEIEG